MSETITISSFEDFAMRELKLDFNKRMISMVSDQKTVIAYMDSDLKKRDFQAYFPDRLTYDNTEYISFDFVNGFVHLKRRPNPSEISTQSDDENRFIRKVHMPSICDERHDILKAAGWNES